MVVVTAPRRTTQRRLARGRSLCVRPAGMRSPMIRPSARESSGPTMSVSSRERKRSAISSRVMGRVMKTPPEGWMRGAPAEQELFGSVFAAAHDSGDVADRQVVAVAQPERRTLARRELSHGGDQLRVDLRSKAVRRRRIPTGREGYPLWYPPTAQAVDDRKKPGSKLTGPRRSVSPSA